MYLADANPTSSHSAHFGGIFFGFCGGMLLLDNFDKSWAEKYILIPGAGIFLALIFFWSVIQLSTTWPPEEPAFASGFIHGSDDAPCCWHPLECELEPNEINSLVNSLDLSCSYMEALSCSEMKALL